MNEFKSKINDEFNLSWNTKRTHDSRKVRAVFIENGFKEEYRIVKDDLNGFLYIDKKVNGKRIQLKLSEAIK